MIWDAARQRIVLFGGTSGSGSQLDDLWEWDGTTWTPRATAGDPTYGLPYGRYDHGLAYDADRDVIVLHGGYSSPGGDTWELAGSQWQRRVVADPGGAVDNPLYHPNHHGMTYHASRGKTLLAASPWGNTSQDPLLTITFWEWQPPGSWKQLPGVPPWRVSPAVGYDPVRQATVLSGGDFGCLPGGSADNCSRGDTWEWKYFEYDPTCGVVACGDGIVDTGIDGIIGTLDDDPEEIYGVNVGSPLDSRLPLAVTVDFTLFFRSPYLGAPDFNQRFTQRIDLPTGHRRLFKTTAPSP